MSETAKRRSQEFLKVSAQFKLGALVTESSHPVTAELSDVAQRNVAAALDLLFQVDADVLKKYAAFVQSGRVERLSEAVLRAIRGGGRVFFTGCGATGRLSIQLVSIWREFWQRMAASGLNDRRRFEDLEHRAFSVMAGGDFALIKSVEGFEDYATFGKKQIGDLGVSGRDVVFAITEGGETSFVIGTAWKGVEVGAKVFFVFNNPDELLCENVQRSREVIQDARIEKVNLTTGPMAITGSTRMQATSIQLCVMLTVLEMVVRELALEHGLQTPPAADVPGLFLRQMSEMHQTLRSRAVLESLAKLVALEESVYRAGHRNNYFADRLGIDVLTDTTERSPTYCTPPFRKFDDPAAAESWSFLFLPDQTTPQAWERILRRPPNCINWSNGEIRGLVDDEKVAHTADVVGRIHAMELMRFKIGLDGLPHRLPGVGDSATAVMLGVEKEALLSPDGFYRRQLTAAHGAGAKVGLIYFGADFEQMAGEFPVSEAVVVKVAVPRTDLLLEGVTRVGVKMLLNALSTCTMVRLGRVMGNCMIWVVASNLKLIDRATRYIQKLTGLNYEDANRLLFEAVEYIEPRMKADQAYPPVVGLAVLRARHGISNEEAERRLKQL